MNMRMGKLLNTLGPLRFPEVQTATAVFPPATEVKVTAPLSSFASASASKPKVRNTDSWEMIRPDGFPSPIDGVNPNSEVMGIRSPTYPPTSVVESVRGNDDDPPGDDGPDNHGTKGRGRPERGRKDKGGKRPVQGCRRPPGGGPGDGDDDDGDDNDDSDDSDRKFVRRMKAIFGTSKELSNDKSTVKEADTIKIPAFPQAESYRNGGFEHERLSCLLRPIPTRHLIGSARLGRKGKPWINLGTSENSPPWTPSCYLHSPTSWQVILHGR